jgi:uncharacterized membrane protein
MNKSRAEAFSDSIFAVAMTLLVVNITVPLVSNGHITDAQLWALLGGLWPLVLSYTFTFMVLSVFWINHNFIFHSYMKVMDRYLNFMNMLYLLFLVLIPFSAHLFGTYPYNEPAALVYGLNILAVIFISSLMTYRLRKHPELRFEIPSRQAKQGRVRTRLTIYSYIIGVIFSFLFIPASIFFYLFPIIFNLIPGSLNLVEKIFGFELA